MADTRLVTTRVRPLTAAQFYPLTAAPLADMGKGKRDRALLSILAPHARNG
jgi:hypothetical protein